MPTGVPAYPRCPSPVRRMGQKRGAWFAFHATSSEDEANMLRHFVRSITSVFKAPLFSSR